MSDNSNRIKKVIKILPILYNYELKVSLLKLPLISVLAIVRVLCKDAGLRLLRSAKY